MSRETTPNERWHALDHLKAAAIVAVVITHSGPDTVVPSGGALTWALTKTWTVFQVPSFLFVSGFLYARRAGGRDVMLARLVRVLVPYLVASGVVQLVGASGARTPAEVVEQLLTASSLGIYYYVALACGCILVSWPLARLSRTAVVVVWVAYLAYSVAALVRPELRTAKDFFWMARDPLSLFAVGFFLSGWAARWWLPELQRLRRSAPNAVLAAAVCVTAFGLALDAGLLPFSWGWFNRAIYTHGVVALFALLLAGRPAGPGVRLLSDATLALYLYHLLFVLAVRPFLDGVPVLIAIAGQVLAGLAGGMALVWAVRRFLGRERARRWFGA